MDASKLAVRTTMGNGGREMMPKTRVPFPPGMLTSLFRGLVDENKDY